MESGNIYLRARYYNADLGRFTQEDPIRDGRNWYSYCDSNPVVRIDRTGQAWETFWDISSLCCSIVEVIDNPKDPMNWLGTVGDLVDVLVPCLGGIGETIRVIDTAVDAAKVADDVHDAAKTANRLGDAADAVGDAIRASNNVGEAIDVAHDANKTTDRFDDISDVAADTKKVTNSNDKKGGEKHQAEIIAEKTD
ncbi:MAG: RHS repeat-associated core domain-containing protein [Clostridia bacterium]|nr:RHS repeat-associated core domain-containing protein [Clostridia bacterium]